MLRPQASGQALAAIATNPVPAAKPKQSPLPVPAERTVSMLRSPSARRPSAFTLIELLVVIAIIADPDRPAVARRAEGARGRRPRAQCANNLKQLTLAVHNYESANQVVPMDYSPYPNGGPPPAYTTQWWFAQTALMRTSTRVRSDKGILTPYYENNPKPPVSVPQLASRVLSSTRRRADYRSPAATVTTR